MAGSLDQRSANPTKDLEWDYDSAAAGQQLGRDSLTSTDQQTYDRRELRRRLSLDSDHEDELGSQISARIRRSILRERLNQRPNLQICFVQDDLSHGDMTSDPDEDGDEDDDETEDKKSAGPVAGYSAISGHEVQKAAAGEQKGGKQQHQPVSGLLSQWFGSFGAKENTPAETLRQNFCSFEEYHRHIHSEAKKALKSAKEMAKMQMQVEKQESKAHKVLGTHPREPQTQVHPVQCSPQQLQSMRRMKVRLLITRIVNRTEELNVQLVKLLEERDDLLMEQDSLLVDIQDLTQFLNASSHW